MFPSPDTKYPLHFGMDRTVFLKNFITRPNIIVGDYTYYDDEHDVTNFEKNVKYHYDFIGDKLIIGKFCQIAQGVTFLMNGIFHNINYITTYPFSIFDSEIAPNHPKSTIFPTKEDTVIGNDVWIGYNVTIMPGVHIGDGAIIGTNSLITKDVAPYSIVGGNPAKLIRMRFTDHKIKMLLDIQWWNWNIEKIISRLDDLLSDDAEKLLYTRFI